ncbi:MAG: Gx transporter family protein [Negativicutes bacterium]|nr:Gx transporter family protein [Negativicutes bacterium]
MTVVSPRRTVELGLWLTVALILQVVDGWLPLPLPVPGVKLGLANIVTQYLVYQHRYRAALIIVVARVVTASLLAGFSGGPAFVLAMGGGLGCWLISVAVRRAGRDWLSPVGLSLAAATAHIAAQLWLFEQLFARVDTGPLWPLYLTAAFVTGLVTGTATALLINGTFFQRRV